MANRARARSTWAAGALSERLRRVSSWRSSAVSGRRGSFRWRDMGHLGARGSPHHYTSSHGRRPTRMSLSAATKVRIAAMTRATLVAALRRDSHLGLASPIVGLRFGRREPERSMAFGAYRRTEYNHPPGHGPIAPRGIAERPMN